MKESVLLIFSLCAGGLGYLIVSFWMNPILRYLQIRHQVTSDLIFYANVMNESLLGDELKERANKRRVSNRKHASEITACYYRLPYWYIRFFLKKRNEDPLLASRNLIGHCFRESDTIIRILSARKADGDEENEYWRNRR